MNDEQNKIDQLFRQKLEHRDFVSSDSDWNEMEKLLDARKKPSARGWFLRNLRNMGFVALLILCSVVGFYFFFQSNENTTTTNNTEIIPQHASIQTNQSTSSDNTAKHQETELSDKQAQSKPSKSNSNPELSTDETANTDDATIEEPETKPKQSLSSSSAKYIHPTPAQITVSQKSRSVSSVKAPSKTAKTKMAIPEEKVSAQRTNDNHTDINSFQNQNDNSVGAKRGEESNLSNNNTIVNETPQLKTEAALDSLSTEATKTQHKDSLITSLNSNIVDTSHKSVAAQTKSQHSKPQFILGMELSAGFVSKKLDADASIISEYQQRRKNEESNIVSMQYGITATFQWNSFMVSSGIGLSSYGEETKYKPESMGSMLDSVLVVTLDSVATLDTSQGQIDTIYIYITDTSYTMDTVTASVPNSAIAAKNGKTKWTYVEIPLIFWYRFETGKITIDAGAGASIGLLQKVNAYYLNTSVTDIESMDNETRYRKAIYNLLLGLRLSYQFNDALSAGVDMRYRNNLNSVLNSNYSVNQKYRSFNTGISIMYKF